MKNFILGLLLVMVFIPIEGHSWCFWRDDGQSKVCNGTRVPVTINSLEIGAASDYNTFTPHAAEWVFLRKLPPKEISGKFSWGCNKPGGTDKLKCLKRGTHIVYNNNCKSKSKPNKYCKNLKGKGWKCRKHYHNDAWRSSCFNTN